MFRTKLLAILMVIVVAVALLATPVFADDGGNPQNESTLRPGYGYGDANHDHSGPRGHIDFEPPGHLHPGKHKK